MCVSMKVLGGPHLGQKFRSVFTALLSFISIHANLIFSYGVVFHITDWSLQQIQEMMYLKLVGRRESTLRRKVSVCIKIKRSLLPMLRLR